MWDMRWKQTAAAFIALENQRLSQIERRKQATASRFIIMIFHPQAHIVSVTPSKIPYYLGSGVTDDVKFA